MVYTQINNESLRYASDEPKACLHHLYVYLDSAKMARHFDEVSTPYLNCTHLHIQELL